MHNWFQTVFKLLSNRFQAVFLRKTIWIWIEYGPCSNWFRPQNSLNSSLNPDNWSPQNQQLFDFNNWQITGFKLINCFQSITVFKPNPDNWSFEISYSVIRIIDSEHCYFLKFRDFYSETDSVLDQNFIFVSKTDFWKIRLRPKFYFYF